MTQKIFTIILVLIVIGGLAWYFNRTYLQSESLSSPETPSPGSSSVTLDTATNLFYVTTGAAREIWQVDIEKKAKKIFTDSDEREKIIKFSNIGLDSEEVVAVTASNKLVSINLDKPKLVTLQSPFSKPETLSISTSGNQIAYTRFSNVEENYGYTLYIEEKTGENRRALTISESPIYSPVWSPDNTEIAYAVTNGTEGELDLVEIKSGEKKIVAKYPNEIIESVDWDAESLFFSLRNIGQSNGTINKIASSGGKAEKIIDFEGGITNFISVTSDKIAYLVSQYSSKTNDTTSGQIYIADIDSHQATPVKKGVQILGWL